MSATAQELSIGLAVDALLRRYKTTQIILHPYVSGTADVYKQRERSFGDDVVLIGRAILRPTSEQVTVIGNGEQFDIAFLFSRLEMLEKFPLANEGEWVDVTGEISWWNRRFRIIRVHPTGQIGELFTLVVVLANTIPGRRD